MSYLNSLPPNKRKIKNKFEKLPFGKNVQVQPGH